MVLESKWQHFKTNNKSEKFKIKMGTVNFHKMVVEIKIGQMVEETPIRRTENNKRERPDPETRHQENSIVADKEDKLKLLNPKDLEWLAWNWRAWLNQKSYTSRRKMVYSNFLTNSQYLPSPQQILHGIILAQIDIFTNEYADYDDMIGVIGEDLKVWKKILLIGNSADMNKPLTPAILANPNHEFVQRLIYIYSM